MEGEPGRTGKVERSRAEEQLEAACVDDGDRPADVSGSGLAGRDWIGGVQGRLRARVGARVSVLGVVAPVASCRVGASPGEAEVRKAIAGVGRGQTVPSGIGCARVSPTATGTNVAAVRMLRPPKMSLRPCVASSTHVDFLVVLHARGQPVNFQPSYGFALSTTRGRFSRELAGRHDALSQLAVG